MGLIAGEQFRAGIGLTTILPDFDWETYSEAGLVFDPVTRNWSALPGLSKQARSLKGCGLRNYVCHPTFRILSLAWDLKDGRGKRWWRPIYDAHDQIEAAPAGATLVDPEELREYIRKGGLIEAQYSMFEWTVWNYHCVPVLHWDPLPLEQMRCSQAKLKASAYPPQLQPASDLLLPVVERKDESGKNLIRKLTMPRKPTKGNPAMRWTPQMAPKDFAAFYSYNIQDIVAESGISQRVPDLTPRELQIWQMDQRINARGMGINLAAVDDCLAIVEQIREKGNAQIRELTAHQVESSTKATDMLRWLAHRGLHLESLDEDAVTEALARKDLPEDIRRVLRIRQQLSYGSVNKLYAMRAQTGPDGRLHDQYSYYGTHTGLWNGLAVQPANLYSGAFQKPEEALAALEVVKTRSLEYVEYCYGPGSAWVRAGNDPLDPMEVIASLLRSMITAAPGHRFISADFTAIQAVALAALAGENWRLEVFETHGKIYEATASRITGVPFEEFLRYKQVNKKHHPHRKPYGKIPELACGFAGWIGALKKAGADEFMTDEEIKRAILQWRADSPWIVEFWGGQTRDKFVRGSARPELYGLEGAAISAVLSPGQAFHYRGIVYQMFEDCLYCCPPSGGFIRYHAPRLERAQRDYADQWELDMTYEGWNTNQNKGRPNSWERMPFYGGIATQNVDSHMCREIQADALLALEEHGYPVVMHTHDEQVAEVLKGYGSVEHYTELVRRLPPWAVVYGTNRPWPVKVPLAWEADFYGKWEL